VILLSADVETTGLDRQKDRIIEMGLALYSTEQHKILESTGFLVDPDGVPVTQEITGITGITQTAVDRFGYSQESAIEEFISYADKADAVIGHNVIWFDRPVIENAANRLRLILSDKLWIDTMTDIPGVKGEQLITMCAKHGFVNPNQHSAEDDAKSVIKLIESYDINGIVERAKSPLVVLKSHQQRYNNADARKLRFRWNDPLKGWFRIVKEMDVNDLVKQAPFDISRADKDVMPVWD
jgi:DNA polymerase III alpha subunit (gram-positive type)